MKKLVIALCLLPAFSVGNDHKNWGIGTFVGHYEYKEPDTMKIYGISYAVDLDYSYVFQNNLYLGLKNTFGASLNQTYDGQTHGGIKIKHGNEKTYYGVTSPRVGYVFRKENYQYIPFFGLSYQYLRNNGEHYFSKIKIKRTQHYFYLTFG